MKTAKDIMTKDPICVHPETKIVDAVKILLDKHFNGLPVVDANNNLVGILTQSDLVAQHKKIDLPSYFVILDTVIPLQSSKKFEESIARMNAETVQDLMTTNVYYVDPDASVEAIASYMVDNKVYSLPIVEDGKLVGIVGKEDVLRIVLE